MAGRRPGCGCAASLLPVEDRPWRIVENHTWKAGIKITCLACGVDWQTKDRYAKAIKPARNCVDKRRKFSRSR